MASTPLTSGVTASSSDVVSIGSLVLSRCSDFCLLASTFWTSWFFTSPGGGVGWALGLARAVGATPDTVEVGTTGVGELAVVEVAPLLTIFITLDGVAAGTAATAATGVTGVGGVATATGVTAVVAVGVAAGGVTTFARMRDNAAKGKCYRIVPDQCSKNT